MSCEIRGPSFLSKLEFYPPSLNKHLGKTLVQGRLLLLFMSVTGFPLVNVKNVVCNVQLIINITVILCDNWDSLFFTGLTAFNIDSSCDRNS